jgi:uncharacterized protein involved in outer membrane biogenesis
MTDMFKPRPLLFVVATLMAVLVGLAGGWLATLPRHVFASLKQQLAEQQNLVLEARNPRFGYDGGVVMRLDTVSLTTADGAVSFVTAQALSLPMHLSALLGSANRNGTLVLQSAAINVDLSAGAQAWSLPAENLELRDATVRLRDRQLNAVVTLGDVNGKLRKTAEGGAALFFSFILNDALTRFEAEVEDIGRLASSGSPADMTLATGDKIISFSGRAKATDTVSLDGQMTADAAELSSFLQWLGLPLRSFSNVGAVRLSSGFSSSGLAADVVAMAGQAGGADFSGKIKLTAGPDRPRVVAELDIPRLDLFKTLAAPSLFAAPWSETALPVADLRVFDGSLAVKTESLRLHGVDMGVTGLRFTAEKGQVLLETSGALTSTTELATDASTLRATMKLATARAGDMLRGVFGFQALSGAADLELDVSANGQSIAALVSTLRGKTKMVGKGVGLSRIDLSALVKIPGEGWRAADGAKSDVATLSLEAMLDEGVARISKSEVRVTDVMLRPEGEIDLLRQAFDVKLNAKGAAAEPKLLLKGTWTVPQFVFDAGKPPPLRPTSVVKDVKPSAAN